MGFYDKIKDFGSKVIRRVGLSPAQSKVKFDTVKRLIRTKDGGSTMITIGIPKQEQILSSGIKK